MSGQNIVAVCQMRSDNDKNRNLQIVETLVQRASSLKAKMVFLPEACDYITKNPEERQKLAEPLDGPLINSYKTLASNNNIWISIGGFHELPANVQNKVYNTHVIINNNGEIEATYRKVHLFDLVDKEAGISLKESDVAIPGTEIVDPVETPIGKVGLAICYDVRFPEVGTALRSRGAEILTYPSAFTHFTGQAHWETLLKCRAIENQCYVFAAAQIGEHYPGRESHGRAMIVDPWGSIIDSCCVYNKEKQHEEMSLITVEIDHELIKSVRRKMPVFDHRKDIIYRQSIAIPVQKPGIKIEALPPTNYMFASKIIPSNTVFYETQYSFAFTNIRCVLPGHVLIASKRIVTKLDGLNSYEIADFFKTVVKVKKVMEEVHSTSSSTVVVQDGVDAGQTIPHVHCHILPRKKGDFERNDDVYDALARHDKADSTFEIRDIEVMVSEAEMLKEYFLCDN